MDTGKKPIGQKFYHVASVIMFVGCTVIFYAMGGGSGNDREEPAAEEEYMNEQVPMSDLEVAGTKIESIERVRKRDERQRMLDSMQRMSSFVWFDDTAGMTVPETEYPNSMKMLSIDGNSADAEAEENLTELSRRVEEIKQSQHQQDSKKKEDDVNTYDNSRLGEEIATGRRKSKRRVDSVITHNGLEGLVAAADEPQKGGEEKVKAEVPKPVKGFYSLQGQKREKSQNIRAVVHGEHKDLRAGSVVKLRLLDEADLDGYHIPRNTFVYGTLSFSGNRAQITIENINMDNNIIPFKGVIYDKDGFQGIYVPDNKVSETAQQAGADMVSAVDVAVSGTSFLTSPVNAVGNAIQGVATASIREPKISISTNYQVTIKPEN